MRVDLQASTSEGFLERVRTVNYYSKSFRGQIQEVREATELLLTISHFPYIHHGLACLRGVGGAGGGGGGSNIKKVGVFVISLRGVNFRFWSRLGC